MKMFVCKNCGAIIDRPKKRSRGACGCCLMGLLCLLTLPTIIIPIIIIVLDDIWYRNSLKKVCPVCGGENCVVPANTPIGKEIIAKSMLKTKQPSMAQNSNSGNVVYNPQTHQYEKV